MIIIANYKSGNNNNIITLDTLAAYMWTTSNSFWCAAEIDVTRTGEKCIAPSNNIDVIAIALKILSLIETNASRNGPPCNYL